MEEEICCLCGSATGRAGVGEDSLYTNEGNGPFCPDCWDDMRETFKDDCEED